jgi:O-methyltransferase involved in polyketide biosynthesis
MERRLDTIKDQVFVLSIAEGFFGASVLFALLRLDLFAKIGDGEKTVSDLASAIGAPPVYLHRLLNAGVMLDLLESDDSIGFRLSPRSASVLVPGSGERYLGDWIRNMDMFRLALADLDRAVVTGEPTVDPAAHLGSSEEETRDFTLAMHNYAALRGAELATHLDTSDVSTLLDLGCGPGTYAFHLGRANPDLELNLLDLPGVLEVAREVQQRFDLANHINYIPIDVTKDDIPGQYDLVLVSNTLHMLGERASRELLSRLYESVSLGGSLVVQAQYLSNHRMGGRWPIYLDLIQMCITNEGRNHSEAETREWMEDAGFENTAFVPMSLVNTNSFLRGYRPAS